MKLSRPPLLAIAPLVAAILIGAVWSVFWSQASSEATDMFQQWRERQAQDGVDLACQREERGGFPFQVTLVCEQPTLTVQTDEGPASISGRQLRLVALSYDPSRVIAELEGPVIAQRGSYEIEMAWQSARMSTRLTANLLDPQWLQSDIVIEDANITFSEFGLARAVYSAPQTQLHLRQTPDRQDSLDAALSAQAPSLLIARADTLTLDRAELIARIDEVPPETFGPVRDWLQAWQANGGIAELVGLRISAGEALSRTSGTLSLNELGYPRGVLNIINADVDPGSLPMRDPLGVAKFAAATVSAVGKPAEIEGRQAREVTLRLERGRVHLGGMAIMPLPRLF